jgi:cytoskeletal protein CcmA (bactofilin family)
MLNNTTPKHSRKQKIGFFVVFLTLGALLLLVPAARAQGIIYGDTITAGETVENDLILSGDTVRMNGTVQGDMLAVGNTVEVNGTVEGSLVALAQQVIINGEVQGSAYVAGVVVTLGPEGATGRNLYAASLQLEMQTGSVVGRDVYAFSPGGATLQAAVGRNFVGMIGPVEFIRLLVEWIEDLAGVDIFAPLLPDTTSANPFPAVQSGLVPPLTGLLQQDAQVDWPAVGDWLLDRLREFLTLLALGGLLSWLFPRQMERATRQIRATPLSAAGWGLMVILAGSVLLGLFSMAVVLISMLFFGLTLNALGSVVLGLGLGVLVVILAAFIVLVSYVTKIIAAALIGQLILERLAPVQAYTRLWPLLLGVFLYVLLRSIPFVGWLVGVVATLIGMGAMWLVYRNSQTVNAEAEVDVVDVDVEVLPAEA